MSPDPALGVLLGTAATVGFVHTVVGVDHSLPFVVVGRARGWSLARTLTVAALCGLAHVGSSVLLGAIGIGAGVALDRLAWVQGVRGDLAAWGLVLFGLGYTAWGLLHGGHGHHHPHPPHGEGSANLTFWALFVLFALGPCEALIPLLMAPAWMEHPGWVVAVIAVFGSVTVLTMLAAVTVGHLGLGLADLGPAERHAHTLAGLAIALSGAAILVLGI